MSIKINYIKKVEKNLSANTVFFLFFKFNTKGIKKYVLDNELSYINDLLKNSDIKKKILVFEINSKKKIFLISIKKT